MAGQFPEELIDLIISHLDDDASIRLCGLVCRSWLYSSRFYAFENVTLNDGNTAPFLELVETSLVSLPSLIGALDLTEPWPGDSESENIDWLEGIDRLGSCPRMTYLYVQIGDRGLSHLSPFLSALSSLTTTEFSVVPNNSAGSILEILPSLPPSVKNLNIFSLIEDFFQDQTFLSASRLPEGLCTLYLSDDAQNFFSALLLLPQTPLLSTVHVRNAWPAQNSALEKYLCFVGEALQELTLDTGDIPLSTQDEPFALRHNTALRHLSIATPPHQMPEVLLKTIPHLSSPELVTISMSRMNVPWGSGQIGNLDSALNPWRAVDSALAGPAFAGLKTLEIATGGARWMPPRRNTIPSQPKNIPPKFKPPPKPKASERIRSAILACILDPKYCPPAFPALEDLFWPDSFSKTEEEDEGASAAERDYYAQIGFATLQQVLFLLIRPHLRGKPVGFSKAVQNAVHTHEILKLAIGKINPKLLDKVSKVEGGCHALVGALWIQFGEDTERVARWLDPIFWPLLEAAGDEIIKISDEKENETEANAASTRKRRVPADLQFLLNLREAQDDAGSHQCPSSPANSTASYACDQNKLEVERNEFISTVDQDELLNLDAWPAPLDLSPMSFIPKPGFADHGEILMADLHDFFQGQSRSPIQTDTSSPWNPPLPRQRLYSVALPGSERAFMMEVWLSFDLDASPTRRTNLSTMGDAFKRYSALAPAFVEKTYPPLHVESSPEQLLDPAALFFNRPSCL
ncbi:hypothetical protein B0H11DRAFT_2216680 [Mycena galericulata]|nr:hypothetical protein B0H11DRAFT_2216680 [Mycena galericulata]